MVPAVGAVLVSEFLAGSQGEGAERLRRDDGISLLHRRRGPIRVGVGLVANRFQLRYPTRQNRFRQVGDAALDQLVEATELGFSFGRTTAHLSDVSLAAFRPLVPPLEQLVHQPFEAPRVQ
ncbi:MAG: hypothetical protein ACEQR8_05025 [Cypionkella sp.]